MERGTSNSILRSQNKIAPWVSYECEISDENVCKLTGGLADNIEQFSKLLKQILSSNNDCGIDYKVTKTTDSAQTLTFNTKWNKSFTIQLTKNDGNGDTTQMLRQMYLYLQKSQPLRVSFDGRASAASGNGECKILKKNGICKVIRERAGYYVIHFDQAMADRNYTVTVTGNMLGTGGVILGLEGNNRKGDKWCGQTEKTVRIGSRCPRANANRDCDLVHVVIYP